MLRWAHISGILFSMLFATAALTQAAQASDSDAAWTELLRAVYTKGEKTAFADGGFVTYGLARGTSFDRTQDRQVQYFTVIGREDDSATFVGVEVSTVQESWTRRKEYWHVAQRITLSTLQGRLTRLVEQELVFDENSTLVASKRKPDLDLNDPAVVAAWQSEKASWIEYAKTLPEPSVKAP